MISLNVGGIYFMTRLSTLCKHPESMLASMFSGRHRLDKDSDNRYFIDSNGNYFQYILDYLRHEQLPPSEVADQVYKEACYYGITPLVDALQTTPVVATTLVKELHRSQFPDYKALKHKIIRIAMDNAAVSKSGEVIIYIFHKIFVPRASYFNMNHECVADTAHLSVGPWESVPDEEALIRCLQSDFIDDGFSIRAHEQRKRCKYYNGQNCQKCVYKICFLFQQ